MKKKSTKEISRKDFGTKTFLYVDLLYTYALLITGDDREAEKLLLKTYEEAYRFYEYLSEDSIIEFWLYRIMMKLCRDTVSTDKNVYKEKYDEPLIDYSNINKKILEQNPSFTITNKIIKTISSLSLEMKEVLNLIDVHLLDYKTTSDLIDVPEGTIKKRLFDARKSLLIKLLDIQPEVPNGESLRLSAEDKKLVVSLADQGKENESGDDNYINLKTETESQRYIKAIIQKHLTSQSVREAIKVKIIKQFAPDLKYQASQKFIKERKGLITGATIAMIILITFLIVLNGPTIVTQQDLADEQIGEDNIFIQLKKNFSGYINKEYEKELFFGNEDSIEEYLSSLGLITKTIFFDYKHWQVNACFLTNYGKNKLVNIIYKNEDGSLLFQYQVPLSLLDKNFFQLSTKLIDYLDSGKCFPSRNGDYIYLLRKFENNILGYVFKMNNKELLINICK